jgi:hypothetical protein
LLQTVEGELGLVVDVNLEGLLSAQTDRITYTLHELFASCPDVLAERGGEHHHLLVLRGGAEDFLDVASHICWRIEVS